MVGGAGKRLFILILVLTLDLLAFTCILPLFPSIIEFYSARAQAQDGGDPVYQWFELAVRWLQSVVHVPELHRYNTVFFGG
jgi:hypothetical protein